jgi:predicted ATPase
MIEQIKIKNFKCFEDVVIPLKPLTVLSGVNGMGKSSFLQSVLLLRQSLKYPTQKSSALFNGPLIELGYADDVLYEGAQKEEIITLTVTENGEQFHWSFQYEKGKQELECRENVFLAANSSLLKDDFYYLRAERIGPRNAFQSSLKEGKNYNAIGNSGEYCASLLAAHERQPIASRSLLHPDEPLNELRTQVEAWLSEIGQTPRIHLNEHQSMDLVNLQFSFLRDGVPSNKYRPTNVGFGLTYSLPVFVSCLLAKPDSMVLIENPEAHLHPKGQVAMGKFLAMVAASGVQVIIETHSDHLLNGIRIATKRRDIQPSDVAFHFFQRNSGAQSTSIISPKINADGRLDCWPEGFFDEWEKGLAELL